MNFLNRFKYARDSYLITALIITIVLMVNFIASRHFVKVDLTKNQLYAVSDASKTIMRNLDDIVTVKVFFSEKLPPNLFAVHQYVNDMLDELSSYAQGNLETRFLDPADPANQNEAITLGIPQIQMNIVEKDQLQVKNGFLGVAVIYGDRTEILPVVQNIFNVEYDLVAAIKKVTAEESRVVAYLTGHGEPSLDQRIGVDPIGNSFALLKQALDRNYEVRSVNLQEGGNLDSVNTLLIAGSKTTFSDEEKYAIDQFLLKGGHLVLFLDTVDVASDLTSSVQDLGLDEFLQNYGLTFEKKLVLDQSNERASFNQGFVSFFVPYPFWVKAIHKYFDASNPIVSRLDSFILPWTSPLIIEPKEGVSSIILASSTPNAGAIEEPFDLAPGAPQNLQESKQYPLAVLLEGKFTSYFKDQKKPVKSQDYIETSTNSTRILAVGNSRFITDRFVRQFGQNMPFVMNAIDFLTLDDSLIGIRSKTAFDLPLKELSAQQRQMVKLAGILLIPALVVLFGFGRFMIRRRKKMIF